ncbi:MAG: DUF262 domain-containing protein [Candidatus Omnitrophota bacterium]
MNLPEPQSLIFTSLMSDIEKGIIKIPQFQRDFVWSKDKSAKLLDSIVKGYPIGTFIFWKTKEELRALRNLGGLDLPDTPEGDYVQYVLDGQQRLTTLFASIKGLKIYREDHEDDYSEFFLDLESNEDESIVLTARDENNHHHVIKLHDLLYGKLKDLTAYPETCQDKIQKFKDRINAYQFSSVLIKEASIDVATEIFTRLNVSGKPLSVFEIMVAKTFDSIQDFDLAEKYDELISELKDVDYGTIPDSVVLQTVSILLIKECRKKEILRLPRNKVIDIWPDAMDAIKSAVDFFRNTFRIPVSRLLPYPNLIVPFAYYFYKTKRKPIGQALNYMQDFFWRVSLGGRYSQSVDTRLSQDILKMDAIIQGELPKYDWAVDTSDDFINENGWFSVGRSYIKALLCILAFHEPKSFIDNSVVRLSNDWLKQANSRNFHHFFPISFMEKKGEEYRFINHIANITIVDDYLNKREIRAQAPSKYIKKFSKQNKNLDICMKTHLINIEKYNIYNDDYDSFFFGRCKAFSLELKKRIIEQDIDSKQPALSASETQEIESE